MKKKPTGHRFRNLTARGRAIYFARVVDGQRIRFSTATDDWEVAAAVRDEFEHRKGIGRLPFLSLEAPTFADFAKRYLAEDTAHLASTTRGDREGYLKKDGPLVGFFGPRKLDEITAPLVRAWWTQEITLNPKRSVSTGRSYLAVLAGVLGYAVDLGLIESSPLSAFREQLRRRGRTKGARARSDSGAVIRPIESLDELGRFTAAAFAEAARDLVQLRGIQRDRETRCARSRSARAACARSSRCWRCSTRVCGLARSPASRGARCAGAQTSTISAAPS